MDYKPYSVEWSRKRYLSEAIQKYFEDNVPADVVLGDIVDILQEWEQDHQSRANKLQAVIKGISISA